jgi:hypothetical protein
MVKTVKSGNFFEINPQDYTGSLKSKVDNILNHSARRTNNIY